MSLKLDLERAAWYLTADSATLDSLEADRIAGELRKLATRDQRPSGTLDELRGAICGIGIVGQIDGHDVIRRESVIDLIDRRRATEATQS